MKALLSMRPGAPSTLELRSVEEPLPGPGRVRIAVAACGVNYPDVLIVQDLYQFKPERPFSPGAEVAGTIDAVGEGVWHFKPGDRVIAWLGWGGMAEKVVCEESRCFAIPGQLPFDVAAGLVMTYGTSQYALKDRAALTRGETLLVLGAAGGVGLAAVELGKIAGARVVAAVSSEAKARLVHERGADAALIYPRGELDGSAARKLAAEIKSACGADGANVVYDAVGGPYTEPALRAIAWQGRYLIVGFTAGIPKLPMNLPLLKGCDIRGVFWGAFVEHNPEQHRRNIGELLDLCAAGRLQPLISERFPLEQGGDAIERLASRQALGKIVVICTEGKRR